MSKGSAQCPCGEPSQTFAHLLWRCPLHPLRKIENVATALPCQLVEHLLEGRADARLVEDESRKSNANSGDAYFAETRRGAHRS